jgi:hypothetical protein
MRNLAKELNVLFVTASQLNRSAVEEVEFDHSHISGGISKINTADNVFGIFTSRSMKERGQYQIQLMKTRSSSGVGQKVDLGFDVDTLRIFDDGSNNSGTTASPSTIMNKIRGPGAMAATTFNPVVVPGGASPTMDSNIDDDTGEIRPVKAEVTSNKLASMLGQLKQGKL